MKAGRRFYLHSSFVIRRSSATALLASGVKRGSRPVMLSGAKHLVPGSEILSEAKDDRGPLSYPGGSPEADGYLGGFPESEDRIDQQELARRFRADAEEPCPEDVGRVTPREPLAVQLDLTL